MTVPPQLHYDVIDEYTYKYIYIYIWFAIISCFQPGEELPSSFLHF